MSNKVNLDKFIVSLLGKKSNTDAITNDDILGALDAQSIRYEDGELLDNQDGDSKGEYFVKGKFYKCIDSIPEIPFIEVGKDYYCDNDGYLLTESGHLLPSDLCGYEKRFSKEKLLVFREGLDYKCIKDCKSGRFEEGGVYTCTSQGWLTDEYGDLTDVSDIPQNFEVDEWRSNFLLQDYVVMGSGIYQVIGVHDNAYTLRSMDNGTAMIVNTDTIGDRAHLWSMSDAKRGDMLTTKDYVCVFDKEDSTPQTIQCSCIYYNDEMGFIPRLKVDDSFAVTSVMLRPAHFAVRNIMTAQLAKAGYYCSLNGKVRKITTKFSVGDWVELNDDTYMVSDVVGGNYSLYNQKTAACVEENVLEIDKTAHKWTVDDAKDGDILKCKGDDDCFIFDGKRDDGTMGAYGGDCYGVFEMAIQDGNWVRASEVERPATKEEIERLMVRITKAQYQWNQFTKELTELSSPLFNVGDKVKVYYPNGIGGSLDGEVCTVVRVNDDNYILSNNGIDVQLPFTYQRLWVLVKAWTIDDAKRGDFIYCRYTDRSSEESVDESIFIYKEKDYDGDILAAAIYCKGTDEFTVSPIECAISDFNGILAEVRPATDDERELLLSKIEERATEPDKEMLRDMLQVCGEEASRPIDPLVAEYRKSLTEGCNLWNKPAVDALCSAYKQGIEDYIKTIED